MKQRTLTILSSLLFLVASTVNGDNKLNHKDNFMRINPNITNEALRVELENLKREFEEEKHRIKISYDIKIEALKKERKIEIKSLKNVFGQKREVLFVDYGESRKKTKTVINSKMEKKKKTNKTLRKSK